MKKYIYKLFFISKLFDLYFFYQIQEKKSLDFSNKYKHSLFNTFLYAQKKFFFNNQFDLIFSYVPRKKFYKL